MSLLRGFTMGIRVFFCVALQFCCLFLLLESPFLLLFGFPRSLFLFSSGLFCFSLLFLHFLLFRRFQFFPPFFSRMVVTILRFPLSFAGGLGSYHLQINFDPVAFSSFGGDMFVHCNTPRCLIRVCVEPTTGSVLFLHLKSVQREF